MSVHPSDFELPAAAVPPPPPPGRSSPPNAGGTPPRRAGVAAPPPTGIGSAKGVRWRGEVEPLGEQPSSEAEDQQQGLPRTLQAMWHDALHDAPAWLVSLIIHLVLILLLALIATPAGQQLGRVVLTLGTADRGEDPQLAEFAIDDTSEIDVDGFEESEVDVPLPTPIEIPLLQNPVLPNPAALVDVGLENQVIAVPPMVSGRSGALKRALLAAYGGTQETEDAVKLGLEWLRRQQHRDGSWRLSGPFQDGVWSDNRPAATAMAMLAFMGAGHTHRSGDYAAEVEKAVKWLVKQQDREGFFARSTRGDPAGYAQAQCTIAICELYAMTGDSWLRDPAQLAVQYAERAQSKEGGWRYTPGEGSDLSVTGWFVMGLESARAAGLSVDPVVMYRVGDYLDSVQSYEGAAYSYRPGDPPSPSMTAEGLLCRQYLGWPREHEAMGNALSTIINEFNFDIDDRNFYYWYYATQVLHHYGGSYWRIWNDRMRQQLPAAQEKRGREAGSWSPHDSRWGHTGGRLYTTCMAIYCLEVYYRHMPLYARDQPLAEPLPAARGAIDAFVPQAGNGF